MFAVNSEQLHVCSKLQIHVRSKQLMNSKKLAKLARKIIKTNIYLTLATGIKRPWASPVYYCFDHDFNFYFISQLSSRHIKNILQNPRVGFAIFDSHQKEGTGNGVQGEGRVVFLKKKDQIKLGLKWYKATDEYPVNYRLFKINTKHFYILDPETQEDIRVRIEI